MLISAAHAAETHAGGKTVFPPFDPTTFSSQIIWLAIVFGILYLLMSRVALPRIAEIFEARKARVEGDLSSAAQAQKNADAAAAVYEKTLADAKANAQATAKTMREKLAAESEAKSKALEAQLNVKLAKAEAQIEASKAQAMSNVSAIAQEAAADIVKQLTGRAPDAKAIAAAMAPAKPN